MENKKLRFADLEIGEVFIDIIDDKCIKISDNRCVCVSDDTLYDCTGNMLIKIPATLL